MSGAIHVINPNSSAHVTAAIKFAARPFQSAGRQVVCAQMDDGPRGIETETDLHDAVPPMLAYALAVEQHADAFVIACFGDPGLHLLRERLRRPVFGIGECGMLAALAHGYRFGVISILETSLARHARCFGAMGIGTRVAGDRAMGLDVPKLADSEVVFGRLVEVGTLLRREDGADVIVMGGAAMSAHRARLEQELGLPVIDPNFAALVMADGVSKLNAVAAT
jgi:Asp/Glu/hydantoin racemase